MSNITTLPAPLSVTNRRVPCLFMRRSCGMAGVFGVEKTSKSKTAVAVPSCVSTR